MASNATSNATCEAEYTWANNGAGIAPCEMAAIASSCNPGGQHTVPPLTPGNHYNRPSLENNSVNVCTCSWAMYNLLSMCTVCQGESTSLGPWASYIVECQGFLTQSDTYFPSNILLPANASFPTYAKAEPSQWMDGVFNETQAKQMVTDGITTLPSDTPSPHGSTSHSSTSHAAIIGAAVGGAVLLLIIVGVGVVAWRSRARRRTGTASVGNFQKLHAPSNYRQSTMSVGAPYSILNSGSVPRQGTGSWITYNPAVSFVDNEYHLLRPDGEDDSHLPGPEPLRKSPEHFNPTRNPLIPTPFTLSYEENHVRYNESRMAPNGGHTSQYIPRIPSSQAESFSIPPAISRNGHPIGGAVREDVERIPGNRRPSSPPPYSSPNLA